MANKRKNNSPKGKDTKKQPKMQPMIDDLFPALPNGSKQDPPTDIQEGGEGTPQDKTTPQPGDVEGLKESILKISSELSDLGKKPPKPDMLPNLISIMLQMTSVLASVSGIVESCTLENERIKQDLPKKTSEVAQATKQLKNRFDEKQNSDQFKKETDKTDRSIKIVNFSSDNISIEDTASSIKKELGETNEEIRNALLDSRIRVLLPKNRSLKEEKAEKKDVTILIEAKNVSKSSNKSSEPRLSRKSKNIINNNQLQ